jgi:hypothetical protein
MTSCLMSSLWNVLILVPGVCSSCRISVVKPKIPKTSSKPAVQRKDDMSDGRVVLNPGLPATRVLVDFMPSMNVQLYKTIKLASWLE